MPIVLEATYKNGLLILDQGLESKHEGKRFKLLVIEAQDTLEAEKERFFQFVEKHAFTLPNDYKFNREEIYER